jgi:hypothetical protein
MGSFRPADLVQVGVPVRIRLARGYQATPVLLVDRGLHGQQEARAQPRGLRAEREHSRDTPSVRDPAGGDHWHLTYRVHHGRHQGQCRDGAPHVSASLPALCDDRVDPSRDRSPRLLGAADRMHDNRAGIMNPVDVTAGIPPRQRHDPQACVERFVDTAVLVPREPEVRPKRPAGERRRLAHHGSNIRGPRQPQRPERAGIRDRRSQSRNRCARNRCLDDWLLNPKELADRRTHTRKLRRRTVVRQIAPACSSRVRSLAAAGGWASPAGGWRRVWHALNPLWPAGGWRMPLPGRIS